MFEPKDFQNPVSEFWPGYFWYINAEMDPEVMIGQIHDMYDHGARSVCLHSIPHGFRACFPTSMSPDYLSEGYFKIIKQLVAECEKLGMNWYLYDEGGWPSGGACGQVMKADPEGFAKQWAVPDGENKFKIIKGLPDFKSGNAPVPNLLNPKAVAKFLELTHKQYAKWIGKNFGKTVHYTFMDEPVMPITYGSRLGWVDDLPEEFKKRKGYDLVPFVPEILRRENWGSQVLDDVGQACADYHDVVSQLYNERFLQPVQKWCREHNLRSSGHFGGEDEMFNSRHHGYGHMMRALRNLDVPGIDLIWRQVFPKRRIHPFPKFASSVAHQKGTHRILSEMFGVYSSGLKPMEMKYCLDYFLFCGTNLNIFLTYSMSYEGGRMQMERPHCGPVDPLWKYTPELHTYTARMSYLNSLGNAAVDTVFYYDVRSIWIGSNPSEYAVMRLIRTSENLMETQRDFDFVDDDALIDAKIENGRLKIGEMSYSNLVLPFDHLMDPKAKARLDEFRKAGIKILTEEEIDSIKPTLRITPATRHLYVTKYDYGNGEVGYCIFNHSSKQVKATLHAEEQGPVIEVDGLNGEFWKVDSKDGSWRWTFKPGEAVFFIIGSKKIKAKVRPAGPGKVLAVLDGDWALQPLRKHVPTHTYEIFICEEKAIPAELGDWCAYLGQEFSGDVCYRTEFDCEDPSKIAFLDLGDVRYACSVRLNGRELGTKFFAPFLFSVGKTVKKGKNVLEITVSNTLANAISPDEVLQHWKKEYAPICPYEMTQRSFEKESLSSGLYGPVRLLAKK